MGNVTREGPGRPGREPDEERKTEGVRAEVRRTTTPGAARDSGHGPEGWRTEERGPLPTRVDGLPSLPDAYHRVVDAGLAALGIHLAPDVRGALDDHVRLLLAWNVAINLTSIRDPVGVAREHVLDSLAALPLLSDRPDRLLDLGSGAGFPGLPLFLALPARRALLVDSVGKKARFLAAVAAAVDLGRRAEVAATRAESLAHDPHHRERWPLVVSRAVAALPELAELALPLVSVGGRFVAWKREPLALELGAARPALAALGGELVAVEAVGVPGLEDHRLVVVAKVAASPASFPRDPALRRREPL